MANNTGNPIGSTAAKDLSDNAQNLDKFANGEAYEYSDRLGRKRKSLKWIEDASLAIPAIDAALRAEQQAERSKAEAGAAAAAASQSEHAAEIAQMSAGIVSSTTEGLETGKTFFSILSPKDSQVLVIYENVSGVAVDTGKRSPSAAAVDQVAKDLAERALADTSKNLFNPVDGGVVFGSRLNTATGNPIVAAEMNASGFIPVSPNQSYVISGQGDTCWYTSQQVFISGSVSTTDNRVEVSPANASFARISTSTVAPSRWLALQMEQGAIRTTYAPYGKYLAPTQAGKKTLSGEALNDDSLPSSVASFLRPSKNLFRKSAAQLGKFINGVSGTITDNATYNLTGMMPVVAGATYTGRGANGMRSGMFYDSEGHSIPGGFSATTITMTVPAGASFLRASIFAVDQDVFQFELGPGPTAYVSGSRVLRDKDGQPINLSPDPKSLSSGMYGDKSIGTPSIADRAVTPDKESWLIPSANLFRIAAATVGAFMSETGTITANSQYFYSGKIPVKASTTYTAGSDNSARSMRFTTYFAADGITVVAGGSQASLASFTTPALGVAFVVVTGWAGDVGSFRLNEGAALQEWKAWGFAIDESAGIGFPVSSPVEPIYGQWNLRETRNRLSRMLVAGSAVQLPVVSIGDSWTHLITRFTQPVVAGLRAVYGDAGVGYVSFAKATASLPNGNATFQGAITYTGAWDISVYGSSYSPDIGQVSSADAGASLRYTAAADVSTINLFAAGGTGVVRYRWGSGQWVVVDLSVLSFGFHSVSLPGWSTAAASTLDIEVVSGAPVLFGLDVQKLVKGIRWNKLGASGTRASQWAGVDATQWKAGIAALAPKLAIILHGTNDQASYSPVDHGVYLQTIITRLREVDPLMDILLISPCENGRSNTWPMSEYARVQRALAMTNKCAYLDLQNYFGDSFAQYSSTSGRPWMNADGIHPEPGIGGQTIVDALMRFLLYTL